MNSWTWIAIQETIVQGAIKEPILMMAQMVMSRSWWPVIFFSVVEAGSIPPS